MLRKYQFEGVGVFLLGLAAVACIATAIAGGIHFPLANASCTDDCLSRLDLSSQQSMSWASWAMVAVTAAGTGVGAATLLLVYATLMEARRSADAAQDAVRQAEATTAKVQQLGVAQYRAYMAVTSMSMHFEPGGEMILFRWTTFNTGQSPARRPRLEITFQLQYRKETQWLNSDGDNEKVFLADIPANASVAQEYEAYMPGGEEFDDAWGRGAVRVEVAGAVHYTDIFGERRSDDFAFRARKGDLDEWDEVITLARRPDPTSS